LGHFFDILGSVDKGVVMTATELRFEILLSKKDLDIVSHAHAKATILRRISKLEAMLQVVESLT